MKILAYPTARCLLKGSPHGEPEHRPLLEERICLAELGYGGVEGGGVGEHGSVGHDGRLKKFLHDRRVISPINAEGRLDHGQHYLELDPCGNTHLLRAGGDFDPAIECGLRELRIHQTRVALRRNW